MKVCTLQSLLVPRMSWEGPMGGWQTPEHAVICHNIPRSTQG